MKKVFRVKRIGTALLMACLVLSFVQYMPAEDKVFCWQVSMGKSKSYLMGSIHLLKKEFYPLPEVIEKAFADSQILAVEADLSPEKAGDMLALTMERGMYTGDDKLKNHISEKTYQMAEKALKEAGMDMSAFEKFKPWMLAMTVEGMLMMKKGFDPSYGVDMHFLKKAAKEKEILELEGLKFQIDLFDNFTQKENEYFLLLTLEEMATGDEEIGQMTEAWARGDAAAMERYITKIIRENPEMQSVYKKLFDDRNFKMADKIAGYLQTGKTHFVVAGAGHLVGENGVIQLLRDKGFKVKQL